MAISWAHRAFLTASGSSFSCDILLTAICYWHLWSISVANSPIFDPVTGFGGTGVPGTYTLPDDLSQTPEPYRYVGCVQTGPFRDTLYTVHLGPGRLKTDHCLVRGINDTHSIRNNMLSTNVLEQQGMQTFEAFRTAIDVMATGIHGMGHVVVGGEMTNIYSAGAGESRPDTWLD